MVAIGTGLIAIGPSLGTLVLIVLPNPHLVVITIISAFMWSLSMSVSGIVYLAIRPIRTAYPALLVVTVLMEELARFGLFEAFRSMFKSGDGVQAFIRPGAKNELLTGISVGVGYGAMSIFVNFYYAVLDDFWDDTAIYTDKCGINFFVAASAYACVFSVLHIMLGILAWPAYTNRSWAYIAAAFAIHLGYASATLVNRRAGGCSWGIGMMVGLVLAMSLATLIVAIRRIKKESA
jgi:gamma-secretase subunit APH-1